VAEFESLVAALEGYFDKSWAELPSRVRQLIRRRLPFLAALPTAVAIIRNASTRDQGTWQYWAAGEASWINIPTTELGETKALVLTKPARLRFNPARLHPEAKNGEPGSKGDWYGTPGCLTARIWDGPGHPSATGLQDISVSVGPMGDWSAETISITDTESGPAFEESLLGATPPRWDRLFADERREAARDWNSSNDPALQGDEAQREFIAGFQGVPAAAAGCMPMWTVAMACIWAATRDSEAIAHVQINEPNAAHWLHREPASDPARSHLLGQAGFEPLPTIGAALRALQEHAARGTIVVRGLRMHEGDAVAIPSDAWANLQIVTWDRLPEEFIAAPPGHHPTRAWWSRLRVLPDELFKVWPPLEAQQQPSDAVPEAPPLAPARRHDNRDWIAKELVKEFPPPPDMPLPPGAVTVLPPGTSVRMAVDRLAARNVGTSQATISRLIGRKKK